MTTTADTPATDAQAPEPVIELGAFSLGEAAPAGLVSDIQPGRVVDVDPSFLSIERNWNARDFDSRENREQVDKLAALIRSAGEVQEPLRVIVRDDRIIVRRGETRTRAVLAIREKFGRDAIPTVPVLLLEEHDEAAELAAQQTNNTGKGLAMLEQLHLAKALGARGLDAKAVAEMLGFSRVHMSNLGILDRAPEDVRTAIRDGWLSPSSVIEELRDAKTTDEIEAVRKKLMRLAEKRKAEGQTAGKGVQTGDVKNTNTTGAKGSGVIFNRGTFNATTAALQDVLAILPEGGTFTGPDGVTFDPGPARSIIVNALENCGAPLVNPALAAEAEKQAKAAEKQAAEAKKAQEAAQKALDAANALQAKAQAAREAAEQKAKSAGVPVEETAPAQTPTPATEPAPAANGAKAKGKAGK